VRVNNIRPEERIEYAIWLEKRFVAHLLLMSRIPKAGSDVFGYRSWRVWSTWSYEVYVIGNVQFQRSLVSSEFIHADVAARAPMWEMVEWLEWDGYMSSRMRQMQCSIHMLRHHACVHTRWLSDMVGIG
jgi:hypothetical protein